MLPSKREANLWIVHVALAGPLARGHSGTDVVLMGLLSGPTKMTCLPFSSVRRHFQRPSQTVGQGEPRRHAPGVAAVEVVVGNGDLSNAGVSGGFKRQVFAAAGVGDLRDRYDAQHRGVVAAPGG